MKGTIPPKPRRWSLAIPLVVAFMVMSAGIASADFLFADGDGLSPYSNNDLALGNMCTNAVVASTVPLVISRGGPTQSGHVFANSATVTVSAAAPAGTDAADVGVAMTDSGITLPASWVGSPNSTQSSDTAEAIVTVSAGTTTGAKSASVRFRASGLNTAGDEFATPRNLQITWTVVNCAPSDTTPPVITPSISGTLGDNGWYVSDVFVTWSVTDAQSAVTSTTGCDSTTINLDTAGTTSTCTATSAGGTNSQSVTIKRDATAPTITGSASPAPNGDGWNNTDVTVSFTCSDGGSGIASCPSATTLSGEGAGQSVSGTATDNAGNTSSDTVSGIKIDKTAPTISGTVSGTIGDHAWYKSGSPVIVSFSCSDGLSGIATCEDATTLGDGANQSVTGWAVDQAGNSSSETVDGIYVDQTPPTVVVNGVTDGATYILGSVPVAGCSTTDQVGLSGVATNATLSLSGGPVGPVTATCGGAKDNAGNTAGASVTYQVVYNWAGFFRPVDNPGPSSNVYNVVKAASAVPFKFSLNGYQGLGIFSAGYPKSVQVACNTGGTLDTIEELATPGMSGLSYDAATDTYTHVWKTNKAWAGTCRKVTFMLIDGTSHEALFLFK